MKYIILFEDDPAVSANVRKENMPQHLAFLKSHTQQISAAGPLHDTKGNAAGGIWIVNADNADVLETLIQSDPLWETGLRKSFRVMRWTQVFADGKALVNVNR